MAKKKAKVKQQFLSPEKFIKERMRSVEIGDCFVSKDIFKIGYGNIIVSRRHTGGNVSYAVFLVDPWCLGVKKCYYMLRIAPNEFEDIKERCEDSEMRKAEYTEVHNIIYGAVAFAEEAGIEPCHEFSLAQYFLEEDTDDVPLVEYDFGKDGKHFLVADSTFEANSYLPLLKKNLGDNFDWIIQDDNDEDYDDEGEGYAEDDDDDKFGFYAYHGRAYTYVNDSLPTDTKLENRGLFKILSLKKNRIALPEEDIDRIMEMPHDSLRRDLEQIVLYGLRVVREEMDNVRKHNSYVNAVPHAVTLLAEVGNSESSLDAALETLKTTLSDYDEIFGDADAIYLFPALIKLGHNNLPKLESFLYEKGFMNFKKANVLEALVNIAYNWPETRVDVVEILRKFLAKALEDKSDSEITDYYLNGMLVWALADLHPSKLLNMIEQLYREDLVDESIPGSWNDVRKEILSNKQQFHTYELDLKKCYSNALRTFGKQ